MTGPMDERMDERFLTARPKLRSGLVMGAGLQRGPVRYHLVKYLADGRTFEVGAKEQFVMSRLDGRRTLAEISEEYLDVFGRALVASHWGQILKALAQRGLLDGAPASAPPAEQRSRKPGRHRRSTRSMVKGSRPLVADPTGLVDRVHRRTRYAFSLWVMAPVGLLVLFMLATLAQHVGELNEQTHRALRDPASLVLVTLVTWLTAAVHELAHGVAARRHGVAVHEIGVHWLLPVFLLYCKVDDYLYVPRRRDQVVIAGSGVLVNFVLLLPVFALWSLLPAGPIVDALAALLLIDIGVALLNLLPVPPLDGYRMLSHALGMADYARQSVVFAATALRRPAAVAAYPLGARIALAGYATGIFVVALGVAGGILVVGHSWTGSWLWPSVLLAALVLLNVLGAVYGARRLNRLGGTGATSAPGSGAVRPVPARSTARDAGPAIVLTDVRKRYGRRRAVDGVTFEVQRGEFLGLLGPNGAGKTTLVEIAVGLRPADSGSVAVLGRSPWPRDRDLLPRIGVQTQSAAFFVRHTAREHLRTVAALYGLGGAAAERALRLVGLTDLAEVRGERLSGGQRQRLAIAAALVHDPELIFLDEPTAALDPQARRALWEVLRQLHVAGRTIVYTTHHLDEAEALCDRVAIISNGRVLALDSPERLVKSAGRGTRLAVPRGRISPEQARALPGVTAAYAENGAVILETTDSTTVLAHLSTVAGLDGVQTRSTSLEDVYLHLVGKEHAA